MGTRAAYIITKTPNDFEKIINVIQARTFGYYWELSVCPESIITFTKPLKIETSPNINKIERGYKAILFAGSKEGFDNLHQLLGFPDNNQSFDNLIQSLDSPLVFEWEDFIGNPLQIRHAIIEEPYQFDGKLWEDARKEYFQDIFYEAYKLAWCLEHNKTIENIINTDEIWPDIWRDKDDFLKNEYLDKDYMQSLLFFVGRQSKSYRQNLYTYIYRDMINK